MVPAAETPARPLVMSSAKRNMHVEPTARPPPDTQEAVFLIT